MNKSKVRGLKWNLKKLRGSVLHFTFFSPFLIWFDWFWFRCLGMSFFFKKKKNIFFNIFSLGCGYGFFHSSLLGIITLLTILVIDKHINLVLHKNLELGWV